MSNLARQLERKQYFDPSKQTRQRTEVNRQYKSKISFAEKCLYFFTITGVVFAAYLIISTYASIYSVNRDIHAHQSVIKQQVASNEALQLQVTELSAPDRILQIAIEKLGMTLDDKNVKVVQN